MLARSLVLPLLLIPFAACQTYEPSHSAESYADRFVADRPTTLSDAVELSAPLLERKDGGGLLLSSSGAERQVRVRMLDPAGWDDVRTITLEVPSAGDATISRESLQAALRAGIMARSAEIVPADGVLRLRLTDAQLEGLTSPAESAVVTLDYLGAPSPATAAIVSNAAFTSGASQIRISGD